MSEAERDLLDAVAAGAVGYLVKSTPMEELRQQLWRAAHGEPVFSPTLAALVLGGAIVAFCLPGSVLASAIVARLAARD